jgi:tRNA-dihydrouridine synthase 2
MGAALLSTPDILLNILRALLDTVPLPISAKIRLLPTQPDTLYLASRILRTGVRNLTVHCRTRDMRPGDKAMWERLNDIVKLGDERGVPVICNGDGDGWPNRERIREMTGEFGVLRSRPKD